MPSIRIQDIADILIMTVLVYQLYIWFRNTKTLQVLIGIGLLGAVYFITKSLGLFMTSWILQEMGTVFFILIIVIFQTEIRQALYRFSLLRNLFDSHRDSPRLDFLDTAATLFSLAATRTGAIVVFQRNEPIEEYLLHGVRLDSLPSGELLSSIFQPGSPLHDGAVVVRDGRVFAASCHLPLSSSTEIPQAYGTRHRAAVGLSERCDAIVVVVSEERGDVSTAIAGELRKVESPETLATILDGYLQKALPEKSRPRVRDLLFRNLRPKLAVFVLVLASWLLLTGRQGEIVTVTAPLRFHGIPDRLVLVKSFPEEVDVTMKVFSRLIPSPQKMDIVADIDLSRVREGATTVPIRKEDIRLPLGMTVSTIQPLTVRVVTENRVRKSVPVTVRVAGRLPDRFRLLRVTATPDSVVVEGPEKVVSRLSSVGTEEVDLAGIRGNTILERRIVSPDPSVKIIQDDMAKVTVRVAKGRVHPPEG